MTKSHLQLVTPATVLRAVLTRKPNAEYRSREYLTQTEVDQLIDAVKGNRYGHRDAAMVLMAYRHGLRASELCDLKWDEVDFAGGCLHVRRRKHGSPAKHPLQGDEMRALRRLRRDNPHGEWVFVSERGASFSRHGFAAMIARAGKEAGFGFKAHPHMLRHACGHALANRGVDTRSLQAYLGHRNIQSTTVYTEMAPGRFKGFWT